MLAVSSLGRDGEQDVQVVAKDKTATQQLRPLSTTAALLPNLLQPLTTTLWPGRWQRFDSMIAKQRLRRRVGCD